MSVQSWEHFFKPEVRTSGMAFVKKGNVSVSQLSDTEIQSYVRASTSFKVIFKSTNVASNTVTVDCTCPVSKKGQFCKHIWAALVVIEEKKPDFLDSKTELEKKSESNTEPTAKVKTQSQTRSDSQAAYKAKQADYRKEQYQKQKQRVKDQKLKAKNKEKEPADLYPPSVEEALKFFSENGFSLRDDMTKESVSFAMKKLARVFHPDVGGSHEEILELNRYADILTKFSKS